ncbi:MAG: hypothetical protein WAW39_12285 [Prosthecobacter sp.]|uniref:hypothetical protein n=1 Tax=Prosthecobacter sp. TaxID=1965333 RepID=UPI003BB0553D
MKTFVSLLAFILTSIGPQAAEIYSQPSAAGNTGFLSSTEVNGGSNLESFVIESFTPATTQTLREIQWRGTRTVSVPVDFKISISPSTVWHTNNAASETPTGTPGVYDYKFTLPAGLVLTGDAAEVLPHGPTGHGDAEGGTDGHEHCQQQTQPPGGRHALREQF